MTHFKRQPLVDTSGTAFKEKPCTEILIYVSLSCIWTSWSVRVWLWKLSAPAVNSPHHRGAAAAQRPVQRPGLRGEEN